MNVISVLLLLCAVDWQTPDGVTHSGGYVFTEADAQIWVTAQQTDYPTYTFTVRCQEQ